MEEVTLRTKRENKGHYVPGMISGNTLYISGQLPVHHETGAPMAGGIAQQTKGALHNVELVLKAAGCEKENVVLCRVYIPEIHAADALAVSVIDNDILDDLSRLNLCVQPIAVHLRRERLTENEELLHGGIVAPADNEIGIGVGYGAERDLIAGDDRQVAGLE